MSTTFAKVRALVEAGDWRTSDHALQRAIEHAIIASDLADSIKRAQLIEGYPDYHAGPCILLLQEDRTGPVHVLWGLEKDTDRPAVLVTAYRPGQDLWLDDNRTRRL